MLISTHISFFAHFYTHSEWKNRWVEKKNISNRRALKKRWTVASNFTMLVLGDGWWWDGTFFSSSTPHWDRAYAAMGYRADRDDPCRKSINFPTIHNVAALNLFTFRRERQQQQKNSINWRCRGRRLLNIIEKQRGDPSKSNSTECMRSFSLSEIW